MTSGYSGTPQSRKLGLRSGHRLSMHNPPAQWALQDPPDDLSHVAEREPADVVIAFFSDPGTLAQALPQLAECVYPDGAVWVLWPRRAAGHVSELTENDIRDYALPLRLVDVKVAAVDEDWSGLKLVWRKEARAAERRP